MSIANELLLLNNTKLAIKEAIINKGVEVGEEDTFASYANKIALIPSGVDRGPILQIVDNEFNVINAISPYFDTVYIYSNTLFKEDFSSANCIYDTNIVTIFEKVNDFIIKLTVDTNELVVGNSFTFQIRQNSFKFNDLSSSITVPIKTTLDMFLHTNYGYIDVYNAGIDAYKRYIFDDVNNFTIDISTAPIIGIPPRVIDVSTKNTYTSLTVYSDDYIIIGHHKFNFRYRDNGTHCIQKACYILDDNSSITKIRVQSYAPWNSATYNINIDFEITFLSNGDFEFHCIKNEYTGTDGQDNLILWYDQSSSFSNESVLNFSLSGMTNNSYKSFYAQDLGYSNYLVVNQPYDITNHNPISILNTLTISQSCGDSSHLTYLRYPGDNNFNADEGYGYFTSNYWDFNWHYNGTNYNTFYMHGNGYIGLGSNTNHFKVGSSSSDKKIYSARYGMYNFNLNNTNLRALKIRWTGANAYGDSNITLDYELYLFENGDAMIYLITGTDGANNFLGNNFSISSGSYVSFYRNNIEGTSWTILNEQYDISHHLI